MFVRGQLTSSTSSFKRIGGMPLSFFKEFQNPSYVITGDYTGVYTLVNMLELHSPSEHSINHYPVSSWFCCERSTHSYDDYFRGHIFGPFKTHHLIIIVMRVAFQRLLYSQTNTLQYRLTTFIWGGLSRHHR